LLSDTDNTLALNEVKSKVDGISSFPKETEKPIVSLMNFRGQTITVVLSGDTDEITLKVLAERMRDDIAALDGISQVAVNYARPYEISIEVSEQILRQYNLTLGSIANTIRNSSLDMPGGTIRTSGGEILLRSKGQAYIGSEYENLIILTRPDGTNITLGEIAKVRDGFQEGFLSAKFNGKRAVMITVYRVGEEDTIQSSTSVKNYIQRIKPSLPAGIAVDTWIDESIALERRIGTLTSSAYAGLALVLLILTMFLRFKVALWVAAGIPIAIMGAIWMFPAMGINISSLSVLAFILVLGIVVDDAIVVGERIYSHESVDSNHRQAAIDGTVEVYVPVIFGVLTTMAAFLPLVILDGRMGQFFSIIGWVVMVCLVFSILESQLILPCHLAHRRTEGYFGENSRFIKKWIKFQGRLADFLESLAETYYKPLLIKSLEWRWITWAIGTAVLILSLALIYSGRVIFQFFPAIEGDRIYATLTMPEGVNVEVTRAGVLRLEQAVSLLGREMDQTLGMQGDEHVIKNVLSSIGVKAARANGPPHRSSGGSHLAEVVIELIPVDERPALSAIIIANRWRELTGDIPDAIELQFSANTFSAGDPIRLELKGRDVEQLRIAAAGLRHELERYPGTLDLSDSFRAGKQEVKLDILPEARNLGLTLADLAKQVRQAFYGEEAQRIQRGTDDVRVMVRYPEAERRSLDNLENMRIRTFDGTEVPFGSVARVRYGNGFSAINRQDQQRVVSVVGDINRNIAKPEEVIRAVEKSLCENNSRFASAKNRCYSSRFPGITISLGGEQEERSKAVGSLFSSYPLAMMIIYA
ncbi:MAG: efflux RND transporter permease subunit, partial [Gammaproteobacteria bacterium]|nr:efflux RND transporter permease subunit [Gammaproteobacteria bacterium]